MFLPFDRLLLQQFVSQRLFIDAQIEMSPFQTADFAYLQRDGIQRSLTRLADEGDFPEIGAVV